MISNIFYHIGRYFLLMRQVFRKPEKFAMFRKQLFEDIDALGINSLGIVTLISLFMGGVIAIQSAFGFSSPWIPLYAVGMASRDTLILEFAPTVVSLILAGKVGSSIASELGTMRVSEQIDALEIMGVNSAGYLILPKITAALIINPMLITISMFLGIFGGWMLGIFAKAVTSHEFIYGIQYDFHPFNVTYSLIKATVFAFIITSVSSYHGYYAGGGAVEVGRASTKGVVYSSIVILIFNYLLTQLLLAS